MVELILEGCYCISHTIKFLLIQVLVGDDAGCAEDIVCFVHDVGALVDIKESRVKDICTDTDESGVPIVLHACSLKIFKKNLADFFTL